MQSEKKLPPSAASITMQNKYMLILLINKSLFFEMVMYFVVVSRDYDYHCSSSPSSIR